MFQDGKISFLPMLSIFTFSVTLYSEILCFSVLSGFSLFGCMQELKIRPCPVVFSSFSGGPKACMYKVLQMIVGSCEVEVNPVIIGII